MATMMAKKRWYERPIPVGKVVGYGVAAWALFAFVYCSFAPSPAPRQAAPSQSPKSESDNRGASIGERGRLYIDGAKIIAVAISEEAFDEFIKARVARDGYGIDNLLLTGRLFTVDNGTRVQVIRKAFPKERVRILEGEMTAMAGWVPYEWVKAVD